MKNLIFLISLLVVTAVHAEGSGDNRDLDQFPFITKKYERSSGFSEELISNTLAFGLDLVNYDIETLFTKKINEAFTPWQIYLPPASIPDDFHSRVVRDGIAKTLNGKITDRGLSNLIQYLGSTLMRHYLNLVFVNAQLTDRTRNNLWIDKLLLPFEKCTASSNNFKYQSTHCLDVLIHNVSQNTPAYITYNLTLGFTSILLFTPARKIQFALEQIETFRECSNAHKTDGFNCTGDTFTKMSLYVYQKKIGEIMDFFSLSAEKKNAVITGPWSKTRDCLLRIDPAANAHSGAISCLDPLMENIGNELTSNVSESKKCIDRLSNSVMRTNGPSYLESYFQVMKQCIAVSPSST